MCPSDSESTTFGRSGDDFVAGICQQVQAWSTQPALTELVEMFGSSPPAGDLPTRLALLDEFSKVWDYRGRARASATGRLHSQDTAGAVRWLIPRLDLPATQLEQITALASELGLVTATMPEGADFDHLLVIGGGRYTNQLRVGYAREMATGRRIGQVCWRQHHASYWNPNWMR